MSKYQSLSLLALACLFLAMAGCKSDFERGFADGQRDASTYSMEIVDTLVDHGRHVYKDQLYNSKPNDWPDESPEFNDGYEQGWKDYIDYLKVNFEHMNL